MIFILKGLCSSKLHLNSFSTFPTPQNSKSISIYNYNMDILAEHRLSQQTLDVHLKSWMLEFAAALSFSCSAHLRIIPANSFYKKKKTDGGGAFISASLNWKCWKKAPPPWGSLRKTPVGDFSFFGYKSSLLVSKVSFNYVYTSTVHR